ncbi:MAG TPA: hypothetical protein VMU59_01815 [Caulobacteraceae bacterium]|nr:hypothetical protein [Caulobacteraceae bacterium]
MIGLMLAALIEAAPGQCAKLGYPGPMVGWDADRHMDICDPNRPPKAVAHDHFDYSPQQSIRQQLTAQKEAGVSFCVEQVVEAGVAQGIRSVQELQIQARRRNALIVLGLTTRAKSNSFTDLLTIEDVNKLPGISNR